MIGADADGIEVLLGVLTLREVVSLIEHLVQFRAHCARRRFRDLRSNVEIWALHVLRLIPAGMASRLPILINQ